MAQYLSLPSLLVALALGVHLVASSHFRGGTIHWRPANPASFDGQVATLWPITNIKIIELE